MADLYIRPVPLCKGLRDRSQWTYRIGYGQKVGACNYVWYIEGAGRGILVDCGASAELFRKRGRPDEDIQSLEQGLNKAGIGFEDIETIILTHLHWDHVANASRFPHATFILQRKELDFAVNPHPAIAPAYDMAPLTNSKLEVIDGNQEIVEGVRVLLTPGHSPGGQSVTVQTPRGLAVITGFCCALENFFPPPEAAKMGFEIVAPGIHTDMLRAYDSVRYVKDLADVVLPLHEPAFQGMDRIPQ